MLTHKHDTFQDWWDLLADETKEIYFVWVPLFTKRKNVLPQDLLKFRSREIRVYTFPIALKLNKHLGSSAAEMPVKFQSDAIIIVANLADSIIFEILQ